MNTTAAIFVGVLCLSCLLALGNLLSDLIVESVQKRRPVDARTPGYGRNWMRQVVEGVVVDLPLAFVAVVGLGRSEVLFICLPVAWVGRYLKELGMAEAFGSTSMLGRILWLFAMLIPFGLPIVAYIAVMLGAELP